MSTMTIGIGAGNEQGRVVASIRSVSDRVSAVCYCRKAAEEETGIRYIQGDNPEEALVRDLVEGKISAAVRGTLPSSVTLAALKQACGVRHLERIALLETPAGKKFLLAPVGVDESWTISQRRNFIEKGRWIARKYGLPERVAVLSGGRLGDVGRHEKVDRSLADAELLARVAGVEHGEILIEDAVKHCGLIIAPDGITGNLIFRTLVLVGEGKGHGALVVNIDKIFVDTSRASPDYTNALLLAASLVEF